MYIAQGPEQITPGGQNFDCNFVSFSHFSLIHFEKMIFQLFVLTNVWGCKFDLTVKRSMVILGSSFEQTW